MKNSVSPKPNIVILEGARTPIGRCHGGLKDIYPASLAAVTFLALLERTQVVPSAVDNVILGNAVGAGLGQNPARKASVLAGLPFEVPAVTVNHVCAGGLTAVILGAQAIVSGDAEVVIAGGTESASLCPEIVFKAGERRGDEKRMVESLQYDGLFCQLTECHMGELCEYLVKRFQITRVEQDRYAFESHHKAAAALASGKWQNELVAVKMRTKAIFAKDERIRKNISMEKLEELPTAFAKGGSITAGNSSAPSDGAAAVLLASEEWAVRNGKRPKARLKGYVSVGVDPVEVFTAGVQAIQDLMRKAGLTLKDIDAFEIDEAFAAQAILTQNELQIPEEKLNVWGGDIALGHPLGAAGARILVTLLSVLADRGGRFGIASICLGGGGAVAVLIERLG